MTLLRPTLRHAKTAALTGARLVGLNRWLGRTKWRRDRLLILCYHGIALEDEHLWADLYVDEAHLRRRFSLLKKASYNVLPLSDALQRMATDNLPERSVSITFDDGAYDFYVKAYPVLREFGYHATLYLTTYYCLNQAPVFDPMVSYLLWKGRGQRVHLESDSYVTIPARSAEWKRLHTHIRSLATTHAWSVEEKNDFARRLAHQVEVDFDELLERRLLHLMNPIEVADLASDTVAVQLHTHRHRTPSDRESFLKEIDDNRRAILSIRPDNEPLNHFCYPSGHYEESFLTWLADAGIESATTCDTQLASPATCPLLLPRLIDTMHLPDAVFESWLSGTASFLPRGRGQD